MKISFSEDIVPISKTLFIFSAIVALSATMTPEAGNAQGLSYSQQQIREQVIETFADDPILINIARCESTFRQYRPDGTSLNGGLNNGMVGVMQIYDRVHSNTATQLGHNIHTLEGNLAYAQYLYEQNGTYPWLDSAHCWRDMPVMNPSDTGDGESISLLTNNRQVSSRGEDVRLLQETLNRNGYTVSETGDGSEGQETSYFGPMTRQALGRFQCENGIVCASEAGYGQLGPMTRKSLNDILMGDAQTLASTEGASESTGDESDDTDTENASTPERVMMPVAEKIAQAGERVESLLERFRRFDTQ